MREQKVSVGTDERHDEYQHILGSPVHGLVNVSFFLSQKNPFRKKHATFGMGELPRFSLLLSFVVSLPFFLSQWTVIGVGRHLVFVYLELSMRQVVLWGN